MAPGPEIDGDLDQRSLQVALIRQLRATCAAASVLGRNLMVKITLNGTVRIADESGEFGTVMFGIECVQSEPISACQLPTVEFLKNNLRYGCA
jgi:hypothetical protein